MADENHNEEMKEVVRQQVREIAWLTHTLENERSVRDETYKSKISNLVKKKNNLQKATDEQRKILSNLLEAIFQNVSLETAIQILTDSALVEESWYLEKNSDVAAEGYEAVQHFVEFGFWEGRSPSSKLTQEV